MNRIVVVGPTMSGRLRRVLAVSVFFVCGASGGTFAAESSEAAWQPLLFSMSNWKQQQGEATLKGASDSLILKDLRTPSTFCTVRRFGDFELEFQTKATGLDLGILVRANTSETNTNVQGQSAALSGVKRESWSLVKVVASQDAIRVTLDDVVLAEVRSPTSPTGVVCLQASPSNQAMGRTVAQWKNARIKDLGRRGWVSLFNGRNLDGLAPLRGNWNVKNGVLEGRPVPGKNWGALRADMFTTDVVAKVVYRLRKANGGLYMRARPVADSAPGLEGVQLDLDDEAAKVGGLFETGGKGWLSKSSLFKAPSTGDKWNVAVVSAHAGQIVTFINGAPAATFADNEAKVPGVPAIEVFGGDDAQIEISEFSVLSEAVPPPLPGVTIGLCSTLKGDALKQARDLGFDYAEIVATEVAAMTDDEFLAAVAKVQTIALPILSAIIFLPGDMKLVGPDAKPDVQNTYLDKLLPRLSKLGLRMVVFGSGRSRKMPDGYSKVEAFKQLVDFGRRAAQRAQKHKMLIVVESLRVEETNMINTAAEALTLVQAVKHPNFKMLVDYYHMALMKEDFAVIVKAGLANIVHAQMANPTDRVYPTSDDEAPYADFFERLRQIGYRGAVSIEASAKNPTWDGNKALRYLRRATAVIVEKQKN
jgi:D-psicose/D-tagatose/L-ribulose 3-epimerase